MHLCKNADCESAQIPRCLRIFVEWGNFEVDEALSYIEQM